MRPCMILIACFVAQLVSLADCNPANLAAQPKLLDRNELAYLSNLKPICRKSVEIDGRKTTVSIWKKNLVPYGRVVTLADGVTHVDTAFMVFDAEDVSAGKSHVLRTFYALTAEGSSQIVWSYEIVWHPMRKQASIIQVFSRSGEAYFSVYSLDLDRNEGTWPLPFDVAKKHDWPREPKPIASWVARHPLPKGQDDPGYEIRRIRVVVEGEELVIWGERFGRRHRALMGRFSLLNRKWTECVPVDE